MEKALNVLKDLCLVISFNSYWKPRVDEAIAELEEAMKPKTCEGCKHLDGVICKHDRGLYCVRQFEADYYEPKDTQC